MARRLISYRQFKFNYISGRDLWERGYYNGTRYYKLLKFYMPKRFEVQRAYVRFLLTGK